MSDLVRALAAEFTPDELAGIVAETLKERCPLCNHTPSRCPGHDVDAVRVLVRLGEAVQKAKEPR